MAVCAYDCPRGDDGRLSSSEVELSTSSSMPSAMESAAGAVRGHDIMRGEALGGR